MFQIWWRSFHKWCHSLVYSRRRPDIGDRRPVTQVILYFVQCYALHWTDNYVNLISETDEDIATGKLQW